MEEEQQRQRDRDDQERAAGDVASLGQETPAYAEAIQAKGEEHRYPHERKQRCGCEREC